MAAPTDSLASMAQPSNRHADAGKPGIGRWVSVMRPDGPCVPRIGSYCRAQTLQTTVKQGCPAHTTLNVPFRSVNTLTPHPAPVTLACGSAITGPPAPSDPITAPEQELAGTAAAPRTTAATASAAARARTIDER